MVSIESSDKDDDSTLSVDCSQEQFRTVESLYKVLRRTTVNEPLRIVEGFEAWHAIVTHLQHQ